MLKCSPLCRPMTTNLKRTLLVSLYPVALLCVSLQPVFAGLTNVFTCLFIVSPSLGLKLPWAGVYLVCCCIPIAPRTILTTLIALHSYLPDKWDDQRLSQNLNWEHSDFLGWSISDDWILKLWWMLQQKYEVKEWMESTDHAAAFFSSSLPPQHIPYTGCRTPLLCISFCVFPTHLPQNRWMASSFPKEFWYQAWLWHPFFYTPTCRRLYIHSLSQLSKFSLILVNKSSRNTYYVQGNVHIEMRRLQYPCRAHILAGRPPRRPVHLVPQQ